MDIRDIARRARVSTATVSRAINHIPTVDPQLARRVWRAVEELGYYPNRQARALVSGRTRIFGLIVSEITNPFFPEIVHSFEDIAVQNNYEILLTSTVHDPRRMESSVRRMIERRVEGVAVLTFGMEESLLEGLRFRKVPLVFVDVGPDLPGVSNIRINYQQGIRQAVQHVAALRHTRVAFITGPLYLKSAQARKLAFESSMREIGMEIEPGMVIEGDHTMEGGMQAFSQLAELRERPTAILCSNDMTAIGVMRQAFERGVAIPRELSLVGFDDIRLAQFMTPPLTSIQMSQTELARLAFRALLNEVEDPSAAQKKHEYLLHTSLILRKSTALAPERAAQGRGRR
ncbi:MAG TPA: LacI family DNA-binding transcriptional regulator [Terriglobales bacterium]|nr:LacI family DNA-binding transcriptional regulator [Terriglobales bacterium]